MQELKDLTFTMDTQIVFGNLCISKLKEALKNNNFNRALLVSDNGLKESGILDKVTASLSDKNIVIATFIDIAPNPTVANVESAYRFAQDFQPDVIIGVGGGSPLDAAKVLAILMTNDQKVIDLEGIEKYENPPLPLVAIPTTAGTGSEVTVFSVITDSDREYKITIGGRSMAPKWAFVDPDLTLSLPRHITASTGLDALVHAIESYTSTMSSPMSELFSMKAIEIISANLRQAVFNGNNLQARSAMIYGSLLAGIAFNNTRLGNVHAMSHPLSAIYHAPHGIANAVLLPTVMNFNLLACPEKYANIAQLMGEPLDNNLSLTKNAEKSLYAVQKLSADIGIPGDFSDFNVEKDSINIMAKDAMKSGNVLVNPRKTTLEDIINLYQEIIR
ncbi:iron-containing alcohol dehydrogenase [Oceanisphaera psychrotolerans]|uniref:Uncharacterized protein n=1 Tax=Oceanisphaera psychrotolerans TaxID=1414654 RepID=A0A1J4QH67_9GAMM|nr:iron-containing alcohol dehydrogenase [Oceanisphaera psychrotolerans]OIN14285.1 hypothetical protein BFR47_08310 [Oceanisphaera psychrotolerans]